MSELPRKFSVLGLPVHVMTNYPSWLLECLQEGMGTHVVTLNAEMTMQAERNSSRSGHTQCRVSDSRWSRGGSLSPMAVAAKSSKNSRN